MIVLVAVSAPYFLGHAGEFEAFRELNFHAEDDGIDSGNYGFLFSIYLAAWDADVAVVFDHWSRIAVSWRIALLGVTALAVLFSRRGSLMIGAAMLLLAHFLSYQHVWETT